MRCVTAMIVALIFFPGFLSADVLPDKPHIYVEGSAQFDVEPDKIAITLAIVSVDQDVEVAKRDVDDRSRTLISLPYSTDAEYLRRARTARLELSNGWTRLVDQLAKRRLLTPPQRTKLEPRIHVTVEDARTDPTGPLPPLPR